MKPNQFNPLFVRLCRAGLASFILFSGLSSAAESISINFAANESTSSITDEAKLSGALPVAGNLWNNALNASGTLDNLVDSTGAVTSGSVTWKSSNTWSSASTGATATSENGKLTKGYLDDSSAGWEVNFTSPYLLNDIYFILATDQAVSATGPAAAAVKVNGSYYKGNGAGGTTSAIGLTDTWVVTPWTAADSLVESNNYLKIPSQPVVGLVGVRAGSNRSAIAGLQVVNAYSGNLLYWDVNGAAAGAGGDYDDDLNGTWGTNSYWSTSASGEAATTGWTAGSTAVFSAGADGLGFNVVTLNGTQVADAIWAQEGQITLQGGTLDLSSGIGLLRGDDWGLVVDSSLKANHLSTLGNITLGGNNTITGSVNISGITTLASDQTFPSLSGTGTLILGEQNLAVGSAANSEFDGTFEGGTLSKVGTGTLTLSKIESSTPQNVTIDAGRLQINAAGSLYWDISGPGTLAKGGTGSLQIRESITPGVLDVQSGTLQVGDQSEDGSIGNPANITLGGGAVLVFRNTGTNPTLSSPISFANTASEIRQHGVLQSDTLTLSGTIGESTTTGTLRTTFGTLTLAAGANVIVNKVSGIGTPIEPGVINIASGATLTSPFFDIGEGGSKSAIVNVNGGTVTVAGNGNGVRIGHWGNGDAEHGSQLNVNAGTFDASALNVQTSIGWDGLGALSVGGGATPAILKAWRLQMDGNLDSSNFNNIGTIHANGRVEIGAGGALGASVNDYLILNGGSITGTATASWSSRLDVANASEIETVAGATITHTGQLSGDAELTKTGEGALILANASANSNTFSGTLVTTEGTTELRNAMPDGSLIASGSGIVYLGSSALNSVTSQTGALVLPGTATTTGAPAVTNLNLEGGESRFRIGSGGDQITAANFTVTAPSKITFLPAAPVTAPSSFTLVNYEGAIGGLGFAGLTLESLNPHYTATLSDDTTTGEIKLELTGADSIVWKGNVSGAWDINASANWVLGSNSASPTKYYDYDVVKFDDLGIASPTVTLSGTITPASLEVANTTGNYVFQGAGVSGATGLTKSAAGTLTLLNDNTFAGAIAVNEGKLALGNGGATGSVSGSTAGTIAAGATFEINRSEALTWSRPMSGEGTFRKAGSGTLSISSTSGTLLPNQVTVDAGTLNIARGSFGGNRLTGDGQITVNPGATLQLSEAHALGGDNGGMSDAVVINGGTFTLNSEQYLKTLTLNGATVNGSSEIRPTPNNVYSVVGTTPSTVSVRVPQGYANSTWNVADVTGSPAADLTLSGVLSGNYGPIKSGPGTMVLTGTNTHAGVTTITEGTLQVGAGSSQGSLGSGAVTNNSVLSFKRSDALTVANAIGGTGILSQDGSGVLTLSGVNTYTGNTVINSGTLHLADNAQLKFVIGANGVSNQITGSGTLELLGDFDLDLSGADVTSGNSWTLVAPSVTKAYLSAFTVVGFTEATPGVHTLVSGANTWTFTESTGILTVKSASDDYSTWLAGYTFAPGADTSRGGDADGDGVSNFTEYAFGLNPTSGASVSPITAPVNPTAGTFKYTRRANSGLTYKILTSTTLATWEQDAGAVQTAGPVDSSGNQEVTVTLTGAPLTAARFFVRVTAE
jgi:fibronectin-binding autotransporter adhesin